MPLQDQVPLKVSGTVVEPVDDGGAEAVEGREVLGAESVDEGFADGGDVTGHGWLEGSQAFRCQHDVHTASFWKPSRRIG